MSQAPSPEFYKDANKIWKDCLFAAGNDVNLALAFFDKAMTPWYYWQQHELLASPPASQPAAGGPPTTRVTARFIDGPKLKLKDNLDARKALKDQGFRWNTPEGKFDWSRDIDIIRLNELLCAWPFNELTLSEPKKQ